MFAWKIKFKRERKHKQKLCQKNRRFESISAPKELFTQPATNERNPNITKKNQGKDEKSKFFLHVFHLFVCLFCLFVFIFLFHLLVLFVWFFCLFDGIFRIWEQTLFFKLKNYIQHPTQPEITLLLKLTVWRTDSSNTAPLNFRNIFSMCSLIPFWKKRIVQNNGNENKIFPIPKNNTAHLPKHDHPISLLSCFSNVFEKIGSKKILLSSRKHKILSQKQEGSISKNQMKTTDSPDWNHTQVLRKDKKRCIHYFWCPKGFESVWVDGLLYKIH